MTASRNELLGGGFGFRLSRSTRTKKSLEKTLCLVQHKLLEQRQLLDGIDLIRRCDGDTVTFLFQTCQLGPQAVMDRRVAPGVYLECSALICGVCSPIFPE
jgi:hypothetical protein